MIRGVAVIDVSGGGELWIDNHHAAVQIEDLLATTPATTPARVIVGDKWPPVTEDHRSLWMADIWVRLAAHRRSLQVEGSTHLTEWVEFLQYAAAQQQGAA